VKVNRDFTIEVFKSIEQDPRKTLRIPKAWSKRLHPLWNCEGAERKYRTSERNIYYDAETRDSWQPVLTQLFELDKVRLIIVNRYEYLYRMASFQFQTASEPQKPTYLSKMVDITDRLVTLLGLETLKEKQDSEKRVVEVEKEIAKNEAFLAA